MIQQRRGEPPVILLSVVYPALPAVERHNFCSVQSRENVCVCVFVLYITYIQPLIRARLASVLFHEKHFSILHPLMDSIDWAGDLDKRKFTTRYVYTLSGDATSWGSKKQTSMAMSTAELQWIACRVAVKDVIVEILFV